METKQFTLGALLNITTERLITEMGDVYAILNWMTNDELFTHQIPRAHRECKPWLDRWFPELFDGKSRYEYGVLVISLERAAEQKTTPEMVVKGWLIKQEIRIRELRGEAGSFEPGTTMYDVPRIPRDDHDVIDPIAEAIQLVGEDRVVVCPMPE